MIGLSHSIARFLSIRLSSQPAISDNKNFRPLFCIQKSCRPLFFNLKKVFTPFFLRKNVLLSKEKNVLKRGKMTFSQGKIVARHGSNSTKTHRQCHQSACLKIFLDVRDSCL